MARISTPPIRYAVVGLGYIAQSAVLPAFAHARENSELVALVSSDALKLKKLGRKYGARILCDYTRYDDLLESGEIDAVYIALPNPMHAEFTVRAARAGIHVLCDKPMAVTVKSCEAMIAAAAKSNVRLMPAYRLHYDPANLKVIELVRSGKIGDPRLFESVFSLPVEKGNIRTSPQDMGGGPLFDIGIYCINASRYLFGADPIEALAAEFHGPDRTQDQSDVRFDNFPESLSVTLRYPSERSATFVCSFGVPSVDAYRIVGTNGEIQLDNAYGLHGPRLLTVTNRRRATKKKFEELDLFTPLLLEFSRCVQRNTEPEPNGVEGLEDIRIIQAIIKSAKCGRWVRVTPLPQAFRLARSRKVHAIRRVKSQRPRLVRAKEPSKKAA